MSAPAGPAATVIPVAKIRGEPLSTLPEDLYIPPDALEIFLETFEGPLDLLLYLIRRQNLDILDIPIAEVTRQYVAYIEMMGDLRIELAAEYLLMATILAEIKSRMLLPRPVTEAGEEEDPRAELVRRLQEYERFKTAAERLDDLPRLDRELFEVAVDTSTVKVRKVFPDVELQEVVIAFRDVLKRSARFHHHRVQKEPLSVRERMALILGRLQQKPVLGFCELFQRLEGKPGAVVAFLAILELAKESLVQIIQEQPLAPLHIKPKTTTEND